MTQELTAHDLPVTGTIPPELGGWNLRNGPNPQDAASSHRFFGDGMIHGVRLEDGRATSYRNRWARARAGDRRPVRLRGWLVTPMTAYPKTCPETGELHFFGYGGLSAPYLAYHRAGANGELTVSRPVEMPRAR
ncbi:carotenoid oxygenase family protein [Streptomyces griseocarneus]|uniref:carotenoid oxygenase family protein n=1 Tax=Streptomyces griseocarneus TaxID=51201 RepID=UPI0019AA554C|nr:hypothetical protein GCM10018779_59250 [Streptomyces griseocarneus]